MVSCNRCSSKCWNGKWRGRKVGGREACVLVVQTELYSRYSYCIHNWKAQPRGLSFRHKSHYSVTRTFWPTSACKVHTVCTVTVPTRNLLKPQPSLSIMATSLSTLGVDPLCAAISCLRPRPFQTYPFAYLSVYLSIDGLMDSESELYRYRVCMRTVLLSIRIVAPF